MATGPRPLDELSPTAREDELWHSDPTDPHVDGPQPEVEGLGSWQDAERRAEERWWVRELAALRRAAYGAPH